MANLIDAYLTRLGTRLGRRLPAAVAEEHLREIGAHLRESAADLMWQGKSESSATLEALRGLGSDVAVADGLIRAHTGIGEKSVWRLAWIPTAILLCYSCTPMTFYGMKEIPEWLRLGLLWLPTCFVLTFSFACWRSRRLLWKPILAALVVVSLFFVVHLTLFSPVGFSAYSQHLRMENLAGFQRNIDDLNTKISKAERLRSDVLEHPESALKADLLAPQWVLEGRSSSGPWLPFTAEQSPIHACQLLPAASIAAAREAWTQNGKAYLSDLRGELRATKANRDYWRKPGLTSSDLGGISLRHFMGEGVILGVVLLFNLGMLGLGRLYRTALDRFWSPERLARGARV